MLIAGIIGGVLALFLLYGYLSHHHLVTTIYTIPVDTEVKEYTCIMLSDLHCCTHGSENEKLFDRIREQKPDFILIPGDMVTKYLSVGDERVQRVVRFLEKIARQYPVYYAPGNHEIRLRDYPAYIEEMSRIGIRYVANSEIDFSDEKIRIYGLDLPIEWFRSKWELTVDDVGTFLNKKTADEDAMNILLAHDPRYFKAYAAWGADLTVSGHLHGGVMRLPLLGGVLSPYLRLFPKYSGGMYEMDGRRMVVGRGLGSHHLKFRWFNPPELVVIQMRHKA